MNTEIFATREGRFGLPAINIKGTEYLADIKSRHWYRWGKRGVVPEYLSTAIEYKLYKLDSSYISDAIVCIADSQKIVESIQLNENKVSKLYINQILRYLIEVYPGNWYYFCKNIVDNKGLAYFFSSDEISKFEPEDLFGDKIPDELLKILAIEDMTDFQVLSPVFYLY